MQRDSANHVFVEVENIRITYVPATDRAPNSDWAGSDVLRFQAYKNSENRALNPGPEFPVETPQAIIELIEALCQVYNAGQRPME